MIDDQDLMRALTRRAPPEGFAERTLARVASARNETANAGRRRWTPFLWTAAATLAACLVMLTGVAEFRSSERDAAGRRAAKQLTLALRITSERLQDVQQKLERHTVPDSTQKDRDHEEQTPSARD